MLLIVKSLSFQLSSCTFLPAVNSHILLFQVVIIFKKIIYIYLACFLDILTRFKIAMEKNSPESSKGRVLVMDDNQFIRDLMRNMLGRSGFSVSTAHDGEQAIEYFHAAKKEGCPFDIVILDLHVEKGMGGKEAIDRLQSIDPDIFAIFMTADIGHPIVANFSSHGFKAALIKPFTINELLESVGHAADSLSS